MTRITATKLSRARVIIMKNGRQKIVGYVPPERRTLTIIQKFPLIQTLWSIGQRINQRKWLNRKRRIEMQRLLAN